MAVPASVESVPAKLQAILYQFFVKTVGVVGESRGVLNATEKKDRWVCFAI